MGSYLEKNPFAPHQWRHLKKIPKAAIFIIFIMILISYIYHSKSKNHVNFLPSVPLPGSSSVPLPGSSSVPLPGSSSVPQKQSTPQTTSMFPYLIEEERKCTIGPPFLLLLIPSRPEEAQTRNALRETWANETLINGINITRLFLLGSPTDNGTQETVVQESSMFHDIIQQDFIDSYINLTLKTLMGIEWVSRLCPNVSYVMKIDTDMFFNPWFLVERILQPQSPPRVNFYTGLMVVGGPPHRDKGSKWYVPFTSYSKNIYPPYCSGTAYVFSGDLAEKIYTQAKNSSIFPFEDVFVGMCLEKIGVQIYKLDGNWFIGEKINYDRCQFAKIVTVHRFTPDELLKLWPDFIEAVKTCS
ncbi:beta-1,3-galactosyltransferase 1-like [Mixophyes fleayi]|uniref:beta-1,3-galactosyltransferase 1-like n=1 Tax=Mixophyes fleayi TaxID=3061075 RepID=UPI003F4D7E1A